MMTEGREWSEVGGGRGTSGGPPKTIRNVSTTWLTWKKSTALFTLLCDVLI